MKFIPRGKECCLVGSQNEMQRCETTLELFCVSFMFLAFLHALNLQSTSCKKERLNISSVMVREGHVLILNYCYLECSVMTESTFSTYYGLSGVAGSGALFSSAKAGLFVF